MPRRTRQSLYVRSLGTDEDVSRYWFSDADLREAVRIISIGDAVARSARRVEVIDLEEKLEKEEWVRKTRQ